MNVKGGRTPTGKRVPSLSKSVVSVIERESRDPDTGNAVADGYVKRLGETVMNLYVAVPRLLPVYEKLYEAMKLTSEWAEAADEWAGVKAKDARSRRRVETMTEGFLKATDTLRFAYRKVEMVQDDMEDFLEKAGAAIVKMLDSPRRQTGVSGKFVSRLDDMIEALEAEMQAPLDDMDNAVKIVRKIKDAKGKYPGKVVDDVEEASDALFETLAMFIENLFVAIKEAVDDLETMKASVKEETAAKKPPDAADETASEETATWNKGADALGDIIAGEIGKYGFRMVDTPEHHPSAYVKVGGQTAFLEFTDGLHDTLPRRTANLIEMDLEAGRKLGTPTRGSMVHGRTGVSMTLIYKGTEVLANLDYRSPFWDETAAFADWSRKRLAARNAVAEWRNRLESPTSARDPYGTLREASRAAGDLSRVMEREGSEAEKKAYRQLFDASKMLIEAAEDGEQLPERWRLELKGGAALQHADRAAKHADDGEWWATLRQFRLSLLSWLHDLDGLEEENPRGKLMVQRFDDAVDKLIDAEKDIRRAEPGVRDQLRGRDVSSADEPAKRPRRITTTVKAPAQEESSAEEEEAHLEDAMQEAMSLIGKGQADKAKGVLAKALKIDESDPDHKQNAKPGSKTKTDAEASADDNEEESEKDEGEEEASAEAGADSGDASQEDEGDEETAVEIKFEEDTAATEETAVPMRPERSTPQWAKTILEQLGGGRFLSMTGATNVAYDTSSGEKSLSFMLPKRGRKPNSVAIVYDEASDLYNVRFYRINLRATHTKDVVKMEKEKKGLDVQGLRDMFEKTTGLRLSL